MNIFQRFYGKFLFVLGKIVSGLLTGLIKITDILVHVLGSLGRNLFVGLGMGGCLVLFLVMGPLSWILLLNPVVFPVVILLIFLFVVVPIVGKKLVSYLEYVHYGATEFIFDRAKYFTTGVNAKYRSYGEYKNHYRRLEEEMRRREEERQRQESARQWEEVFRQFYQQYRGQESGQYDYGGYRQSPYGGPIDDFKAQYEGACDLLGVDYGADEYEIKLAYRKKAKEYHPDLNKSDNATEMFQKINAAYEFLNDKNIERYRSMN